MNVKIFNHVLQFRHIRLKERIGAVNSLCQDGYHVGFIDADNFEFQDLQKRILLIQRIFDLSTCYVFSSSKNNYHLIFLDKGPLGFWIEVMKLFDNEKTRKYQRFMVTEDRACLRVTAKNGKVPFLSTAFRRMNRRQKSFAHWRLLTYVLNAPTDPFDSTYDNETRIFREVYRNV